MIDTQEETKFEPEEPKHSAYSKSKKESREVSANSS